MLAAAAPKRQPSNRELAAISVCRFESTNWRRRKSNTPLMTAVSNPKRNPEIAAVVARSTTYVKDCAFASLTSAFVPVTDTCIHPPGQNPGCSDIALDCFSRGASNLRVEQRQISSRPDKSFDNTAL